MPSVTARYASSRRLAAPPTVSAVSYAFLVESDDTKSTLIERMTAMPAFSVTCTNIDEGL